MATFPDHSRPTVDNYHPYLLREHANLANSCFYLRAEKDDNKVILEDKDLEVIGSPNVVLYDDTTIIVQHIETGYWMSYKVSLPILGNLATNENLGWIKAGQNWSSRTQEQARVPKSAIVETTWLNHRWKVNRGWFFKHPKLGPSKSLIFECFIGAKN